MRISPFLTLTLAASLMLPATAAQAQGVGISINAQLGPALDISLYSANQFGDWHQSYLNWTPVRVYYLNGHYYRRQVRGARLVVIYSDGHRYFFPPRDRDWNNVDRRYDYRGRPTDDDYARFRGAPDPRLGADIAVLDYRPDRFGDWHQNYHTWQVVTLYQAGGRYYDHTVPGGRPVMMYHYRNGYFLPPGDRDWANADHRFGDHRPVRDDGRGKGKEKGHGRGHDHR
ncbi:MAG: hypothetical protein ACREL4_04770 [Gemmatimonadales bacterium]